MTGMYIQMVLALGAVVGLIYAVGFFLKKKQQGRESLMNILAYQSFGQRKGIAALKIGKEVLLVGVTSTDIKLLKTYAEEDLEKATVSELNDKLKKLKDFKENLSEIK